MSKIVSQLDANGYFSGPALADVDQLVKGGYLSPSGCIDMAPPASIAPNMRYKPAGEKWIEEPIPVPIPEPEQTAEEIAVAEADKNRTALLAGIAALEFQQARPVREIMAAMAAGTSAPAFAVSRLAEIDASIAALRAQLP